jgi:hypothetical protein
MRVTLSMPSPPAGPVPAMIILRTSRGCCCAITWAIMPPSENPNRSTCPKPSARMKVVRVAAHLTLVPGIAELLKSEAADEVVLVAGGTIPNEDIPS